jgi:hypothetical protein
MQSVWCYRGYARVSSNAPDANRVISSQPVSVLLDTYLKEHSQRAQRNKSVPGAGWSSTSIFALSHIYLPNQRRP